jgi:hypothetical protein
MERLYHLRVIGTHRQPYATNGGATVHLQSVPGDPLHLDMRVAYCNPKDVFSRKEGRDHCTGRAAVPKIHHFVENGGPASVDVSKPALDARPTTRISLRKMPGELGKVWREIHRRSHVEVSDYESPNFDARLREWLPS